MRVLGENKIYLDSATVGTSIYEYQRLFYDTGTLTGGPFVVGNTVTGGTSGNSGTIAFIGADWLDIELPNDIDFLNPNQGQGTQSTEVITSAGASATTVLNINDKISGRPLTFHPDFPSANIVNTNRNLITPAKSYQDLQERNFKQLKVTTAFSAPERVSCIAIIGHNLTSTASIQVHVFEGVTEVFTDTIINPNRVISQTGTQKAINSGSTRADNTDTNNVFILYFPTTYDADTIEIDIVDSSNPESYIWIGSMYVGEYWEPTSNTYYGWSTTLVDTSSIVYAQSPYSIERPKYHMLDLTFRNLVSSEGADWQFLFKENGKHLDIIIDAFQDSLDDNEKYNCYYCRFSVDNIIVLNDTFERYSLALQFRESI